MERIKNKNYADTLYKKCKRHLEKQVEMRSNGEMPKHTSMYFIRLRQQSKVSPLCMEKVHLRKDHNGAQRNRWFLLILCLCVWL